MSKYLCQECHYLYDDAMEEVRFEDLPDSWECPVCGAPKSKYALKETDWMAGRLFWFCVYFICRFQMKFV